MKQDLGKISLLWRFVGAFPLAVVALSIVFLRKSYES